MDETKVAVGSVNPAKIEAVRLAFKAIWPQKIWNIQGVSADSGVSNQPKSDTETITGARNRSIHALKELQASYGVGIEGGLEKIGDWWFESGWIVVTDHNGNEGVGSTIRMEMSQRMMTLIESGLELGEVDNILFKNESGKKLNGHYGLMTNNVLTRTNGYRDGVITALVRFIQPGLFKDIL